MTTATDSYEAFKRWRESWYQRTVDFAKRCRDTDRQRQITELNTPSSTDDYKPRN
jgi:phosphoketolase